MGLVRTWTAPDRVAVGDEFDLSGSATNFTTTDNTASWSYRTGDPYDSAEDAGAISSLTSPRASAWVLDAASDHVSLSTWARWVNSVGSGHTMLAMGNDNGYAAFGYSSGGSDIVIYSGVGNTLTDRVTQPIPGVDVNAWQHIDWSVERLDATDARVRLLLNGASLIDEVVAHELGSDPIDRAGFRVVNSVSTSREAQFAHMVVDDAGTLRGPLRIFSLRPSAQGFHDEWSPAGEFGRINNRPPSTSEITGDDGERTTYEVADRGLLAGRFGAGAITSIPAVNVRVLGSSTGVDTRSLVRRGSSDETGPLSGLGSGLLVYHGVMDLDPHTSAPWDVSTLLTDEWGLAGETP